jgi:DNA-binding response OmpR family regulator
MAGPEELSLLLVESRAERAWPTAASLEAHGVPITRVLSLALGLREALRRVHDAVVLELARPTAAALGWCRDLRAHSDVPLLVISAAGVDETERVAALEAGADACLSEPISATELMAQVQAAVRRARSLAGPSEVLRAGPLELFPRRGTATLHGAPLAVTRYEFAILRVLAERRGRVLTREQILDYAKGGAENAFDRSIDVRISRLRRKLGGGPDGRSLLRTIRGCGYALAPE